MKPHQTTRPLRSTKAIPAFALAFAALATQPSNAQTDQVRTTTGTVSGQVTAVSPASVTVTRGSTEKQVSVGDIKSVQFGGEPSELRQARTNFRNGGYRAALNKLREIDQGEIDNPYVTEEVLYFIAACEARLALFGEGSIANAGRGLDAFLKRDPKGLRWLAGTELMGDVFVAAKRYDQAEARYKQLARAPWPAAKVRASVLLGEVSQAKGEHEEAIRRFDAAVNIGGDSPELVPQKLRAKLGRAVSLASTGKLDEGVALVEAVIRESAPEDRRLNASAYNALGGCYREAGKTKEAAFAYLHVDLLYSSAPEAHAEALYHLGSLLEEIGKPNQARAARQTLKERYASSSWAKK